MNKKELEARLKDYYGLTIKKLPAINLSDGTVAESIITAWLLMTHETTKVFKSGKKNIVNAYESPGLSPQAAEIVSFLSAESLQKAILELGNLMLTAEARGKKMFLAYPVCRYADNDTMGIISKQAEKWQENPYQELIPPMRTFRTAVLYSNTTNAALFAAKYQDLEKYAEVRKTDVDTIRDSLLLSLTENNQAIRQAGIFLYEDFLSGRKRNAEGRQKTYLNNPTLCSLAGSLVWEQSGLYFTVNGNQPIVADENVFRLSEAPIRVAHPLEMKQDEINSWQRYFSKHKIKQLFVQIWEPVHAPAEIKTDRYMGVKIEVGKFKDLDEHGIHGYGLTPFSLDYGLQIDGCELSYQKSSPRINYDPDGSVYFILGEFSWQEYTRKTNHIVTILDKLIAEDKIKQDDVSVMDMMPDFTLAQITDFIAAAQEANANNVLAALLEYKNNNFSDFDPMDEFTLEW